MLRLLGILVTIALAISAAIITWPQFFRLERETPFAHLVSLRPVLVLAFAAVALIALLLCLGRRTRGFGAGIAIVAVVAGVANVGILATRGFGSTHLPAATDDSIRVMPW